MAGIPGRAGDRADDLEFGPQDLQYAAGSAVPVLITAGSPTECESYARLIHDNGTRHQGPFLAIRCDATHGLIPPRTLAGARGGTLFLDEIGGMHSLVQRQFLALMDAGDVGARIIAGTSRSLLAELAAGTFNEALFSTERHSPAVPSQDQREGIAVRGFLVLGSCSRARWSHSRVTGLRISDSAPTCKR
ncbi:MAG: sigma 54-interacting transcriptional regulator [Vicinamibacterales bacterium]